MAVIAINAIAGAYERVRRFGGAPVNGVSGTFAGQAPPGALLVRTDTGVVYANTGTKASPAWVVAGTQV
jgi:hypothetical protein